MNLQKREDRLGLQGRRRALPRRRRRRGHHDLLRHQRGRQRLGAAREPRAAGTGQRVARQGTPMLGGWHQLCMCWGSYYSRMPGGRPCSERCLRSLGTTSSALEYSYGARACLRRVMGACSRSFSSMQQKRKAAPLLPRRACLASGLGVAWVRPWAARAAQCHGTKAPRHHAARARKHNRTKKPRKHTHTLERPATSAVAG